MKLILALTAASLIASGASAAACRDDKGKFIKCPPAKAVAAGKCRDAKGHFAKCGTPGVKPA